MSATLTFAGNLVEDPELHHTHESKHFGACGQAHGPAVGVFDQHGAGLSAEVWRDPSGPSTTWSGPVDVGGAGGDLPRLGGRVVAAGDRHPSA